MPTVRRSALVPFSARQMFELVDDIESYPRYLPWCRSTRIHHRDADEVRASIEIAKGAVRKSFTTRNLVQRNKMIVVRLVVGPFKRLNGFWRFESLGDEACKVSLDLEFEFANRLVSSVVGPVFHQIANTMVESFCTRARQIYG